MIINRSNYEEYFLLYTDNELSKDEREAVERFVEENPDLKNELLGLQGTILNADENIRFPGKKELLSSNASLSIINNENYIEYFLLYGDNELSNEEKAQVEQYVYHNPELQEEFELLLAIKAEPDRSITFKNKEVLMRQPAGGRVIAGWVKFSASIAAALILLVLGFLKYNAENDVQVDPMISQQVVTDTPVGKKPLITIENKVDQPQTNEKLQPEDTKKNIESQQKLPETAGVKPSKKPGVKASIVEEKAPVTEKTDLANMTNDIPPVQPKAFEAPDLPATNTITASISVEKIQNPHHDNLQINTPVLVARLEEEPNRDSDISIAGIAVTPGSKVGTLISRTSHFINKTKKEISNKTEQVLGNFEIAIR